MRPRNAAGRDRRSEATRKSWSRYFTRRWSIHAVNFWPMFFGNGRRHHRRADDRAQDRNTAGLWPIAAMTAGIGTAHPDAQIRAPHLRGTGHTKAKHWEPRCDRRHPRRACSAPGASSPFSATTIRSPLTDPAVTIGYTAAGGAARNYGSPKLIQLHILFACGPMSLALALHGGFYYIAMAVLVLFFVALKHTISLHDIFVKALTSSFQGSCPSPASSTPHSTNTPHACTWSPPTAAPG